MPNLPNYRLDLSRKLLQESVLPYSRRVASGEALEAPLVVELDPTTFCDLACPECVSLPLLNQGGFSSARLIQLVEELVSAHVAAVVLIGGGEPLIHPASKDVIERLGHAGIQVGITTNGTQLLRHVEMLAQFASWTRVSVDAATPEDYARFRPHRSGHNLFTQVIEGIRHLARIKRGQLGFSYLLIGRWDQHGEIIESNFQNVTLAAKLAQDLGCDYFELKPSYGLDHFLVQPPAGLIRILESQLKELQGLSTNEFSVLYPSTIWAISQGQELAEQKQYTMCPISQMRTLITSQGAFICPYHRGNLAARYGDPLRESLQTMWCGDERRNVLERINPSRDCQFHCIRHESNILLNNLDELSDDNRVVPDFDMFI